MADGRPDLDTWDQEWAEVEASWRELIPSPSSIIRNSGRVSDLEAQLELAAAKTSFDVVALLKAEYTNKVITPEILAAVVSRALAIFMRHWKEGLSSQNLSGLIEIVLERQDLTPAEMKGFLRALPLSLITRMCDSAVRSTSATGIHALVAIEHQFRNGEVSDYTLGKEMDRTYAEFRAPEGDVRVYLDEYLDLK